MTRHRRFTPLRRNVQIKTPIKKIVIYSEGEKTERDYFEAIKRIYKTTLIDIEIIDGAGVPLTIAQKATEACRLARRKNKGQSYTKQDQFWAVFDRDEHPNIPEAKQLCRTSGVQVAFSDPCFEVWLILHFQEFDRPDHRHDVQRCLERICPDYNRTRRKTTDCNMLMQFLDAAEDRAEKQFKSRLQEGDPPGAPHTTVYELTRAIRKNS